MSLSLAYEAIYDELLRLLGSHCEVMPDEVCLHWPMHEPGYGGKLLVVGQALNGWAIESAPCGWTSVEPRLAALARTRATSESPAAFDWMRPRVWSRPFWKLAQIAMRLTDQELNQIAWSNLAKVAPALGRNPHRELLWSQHRLGGALLGKEVMELNPDMVLLVSGRAYAEPFLREAGLEPNWDRRGALEFDGKIGGRRWIIVSHPGTFAHRYDASSSALEQALHAG